MSNGLQPFSAGRSARLAGHSEPRRFRTTLLLTALWTVNTVLVAITLLGFLVSDAGYDWLIYREAGRRVGGAALYAWDGQYTWNYSPLLAYVFALLAPLGYVGWSLIHFGALAALRDKWLIAITAASWPFWADVYNGNTMVFVFVAAVAVLRRSTIGTAAYLVLCLLMPRPVMLPLLIWVLWTRPGWRGWFALAVLVNALMVLATGYGPAWVETLLRVGDEVARSSRDIGPSRLLGALWLPLGAILAIVLTIRGRIGLASMAASPYWLPQYLLMAMLELVRRQPGPRTPDDPGADGKVHL